MLNLIKLLFASVLFKKKTYFNYCDNVVEKLFESLKTQIFSEQELFIPCELIKEWISFTKYFVIFVSQVIVNIPIIID